MRFMITLGGQPVILNAEQLEKLVDVLHGVEFLDSTYVSSTDGGGEDGTNYIKLLRPFAAHDKLDVKPLHEDYYQTRVLITKLYDEKKSKK